MLVSVNIIRIALLLLSVSCINSANAVDYRLEYEKKLKSLTSVPALSVDGASGEQVALYSGKLGFRTVEVSLPGNSSLPVEVARTWTQDYSSRSQIKAFEDWDLDVPYVSSVVSKTHGWVVLKPEFANERIKMDGRPVFIDNDSYKAQYVSKLTKNRCSAANNFAAATVENYQKIMPPSFNVLYTKLQSGGLPSGFDMEFWQIINPSKYWNGYEVNVPGAGRQSLLIKSAENNNVPSSAYSWVTDNGWVYSCIPDDAGGEGFMALATDGTKYFFNHLAYLPYQNTEVPAASVITWMNNPILEPVLPVPALNMSDSAVMKRVEARLYVSRVEDRFGNWVSYDYSNAKLNRIYSNDGRDITLSYNARGAIQTINAVGRSWNYTYVNSTDSNSTGLGLNTYFLQQVTQPDASKWTYDLVALMKNRLFLKSNDDFYLHYVACMPFGPELPLLTSFNPRVTGSLTTPQGTIYTYAVSPIRHNITHAQGYLDAIDYCSVVGNPRYFDSLSLVEKKVTGQGLNPATWTYAYPQITAAFENDCLTAQCADEKTVNVTDPDGSVRKYSFGVRADRNLGLVLGSQVYVGNQLKQKTVQQPIYPGAQSTYPVRTGHSIVWPEDESEAYSMYVAPGSGSIVDPSKSPSGKPAPIKKVTITQDGVNFVSTVNAFNTFAQPTNITKSSSLGSTSTDTLTYENNLNKWVLGQVKTVTNSNTGKVVSQTNYDAATALPLQSFNFGLLQNTMSYNTDGTLATVKDAKNNTVTLSNYKRGIPQNVGFADGTGISAVVNDSGWVTSVADQLGSTTSYEYDLMGRLRKTLYPVGDTNAWQPTNTWFRQQANGVWANSVWDDRYAKATQYDALWRPTLQTEWDWADGPGTQRQTSWRYDSQGRVAFQSYPYKTTTDVNTLPGIHTEYDALGRVTKVKQDSELGQLTTTTEYLAGFQTKVTNPKGVVTRQGYQVFDAPDTSRPVFTVYAEGTPESKISDVIRDVFGKATYTQMRNPSSSQYFGRSYVFDANERLCKTVVPEQGATHYEYDANNNVIRMAEGDHTYFGAVCDAGNIALANKTVTTYDAMNRVTNIDVPGGNFGDKSYLYEADGLVKQINTVSNNAGIINRYFYNKRRLLVNEQSEQTGWYNWGVGYDYNNNAALSRTTYPTGFYVDYAPNGLGQATQAASVHGSWANAVQYYPNGAVKQFTYGNGIVHTMTQNARQLPVSSRDALGNTSIIHFDTTFDANGNVINYNDPGQGGRNNRAMQYDALDRLTQAYAPNLWNLANYQYDALDNLKRSTLGLAGFTYNYDANNRLSRVDRDAGGSYIYTYDGKGNVTNNGRNVFTYDGANRMYDAAGVEGYRYDGNNRRVLAWAPVGGSIISMYGQDGTLYYQHNDRETQNYEYIYLNGDPIAFRNYNWANGTAYATLKTRFQHTDALGSPVATTDEAGNVVERTEYAPYGAPLNRPVSGVGYTGHVMDQNTGLVYAQQRYYDPMLGRFLSPDPVETNPNNGASFNRYAYANNNPYLYIDPDGRDGACFYGASQCGMVKLTPDQVQRREAAAGAAGGLIADFTPIVSDVKAIAEAYQDPSAINIIAAGVGFVPLAGDAVAKTLKVGDKIVGAGKGAEKAITQGPRYATGKLREQVLDKGRQADGSVKCTYCGKPTATASDHVVPHSKGGPTSIENLDPACTSCNSSKGAKELGTEWVPPKDRK